jgi:hypothetical protein
MGKNLKHSPDGLIEALEHHVVYEVNMLRHTFGFLHLPAWSPALLNAIIESFCVHARNLIDFFDEKSATPGQSNFVGAKHFCSDEYKPWSRGSPSTDLRGRLNKQISHISYERTSRNQEKVGPKEQLELVRLIEGELEIFAKFLRKPYASRWPFGGSTIGEAQIKFPAGSLGQSNTTGLVAQTYVGGWTGPAGPATKR